MRQMLDDNALRDRAADLGRKIRSEGNGVRAAVRYIEAAAKEGIC
jgi:hypothetical protein